MGGTGCLSLSLLLSLSNNAKRNTWARSARREDKRITGALCQRDPLPLHPSAEPRARRPTIFNAILRAPVLVTPLGLQDAQSLRTDNQFSLLYINFRDARLARSDGPAVEYGATLKSSRKKKRKIAKKCSARGESMHRVIHPNCRRDQEKVELCAVNIIIH